MQAPDLENQIAKVAVLAEPLRRALYEFVAQRAPQAVSRDEAASAIGIRRSLAAFHLDKLAESGLLQPIYRRLSGRVGPGAGRPTKLYTLGRERVAISLPARHPDLMARFLVRAIVGAPTGVGAQKARQAAHDFGHGLGSLARSRAGKRSGRTRLREEALAVLREQGFEPIADGRGNLTLRNCPFDPLPADFPGTICDINLAMQQGLLEGLGPSGLRVELAPAPGRCCVTFHSGR